MILADHGLITGRAIADGRAVALRAEVNNPPMPFVDQKSRRDLAGLHFIRDEILHTLAVTRIHE